jgi:maltose O-acetyltransferase
MALTERMLRKENTRSGLPAPAAAIVVLLAHAGLLARLMDAPFARRLLGPAGRRAAFVRLGADIAPDVAISYGVSIRYPRNVSIGAGTRLSGWVRIEAWEKVTIGRCCMFNDDVLVLTAQHDVDTADFAADVRPVVIEDYVWLPQRIVVLPGVHVGRAAVVGTGSVVTHDVPAYAIVAGNPARIVRERARVPFRYVPANW